MGSEIDVLFLGDHLGYAGGIVHGVTTYCRAVFPRLIARGVRFRCVFLGESHPAAESLRGAGMAVEFLESGRRGIGVALRVADRVRRLRPGVVHVTQQKSTVLARTLARFYDFSVVAHLHDFEPVPLGLKLTAALAPLPASMLCVSAALIPVAVEQYGIPRDRCIVLHNGLDLTRFRGATAAERQRVRTEFQIPADAPVLGMAVRLDADKRPLVFVRDAVKIAARCPAVHFLVAGDGAERAACEQLAGDLGLGARMRFTGFRSDVNDIIEACDIMTLYSLVEACPYAAMEALAMGKPVLGFDSGGMPEIVRHGASGLLADPAHPEQIIEHAVRLINNPSLRSSMSDTCRLGAEHFSIDRHVDTLLRHYEESRAPPSRQEPHNT